MGPVTWMPHHRTHPDPSDPWRLVEHRELGLLRYARARGTMALPVRYGVSDHRIYVRLPAFNDASHFVDRADVALDVEAAPIGHSGIVRVTGVGLLISEASTPAGLSGVLDAWPPEVPTTTMVLVPESVHRFAKADDLHDPPIPTETGLPGTFVDPLVEGGEPLDS